MNYSIALKTLITKEVFRFIRIWPQTLLPPAITTALYFLIFGKMDSAFWHLLTSINLNLVALKLSRYP